MLRQGQERLLEVVRAEFYHQLAVFGVLVVRAGEVALQLRVRHLLMRDEKLQDLPALLLLQESFG